MENINETYLSDWLAHKISDDQLKHLVSEDDFLAYQKLKITLENYSAPSVDMDRNFEAVKQKMQAKKQPTKVISFWKYAAVAACLLTVFGLYQMFYFSNVTSTGFGETKSVVLNDNSHVMLNSKSEFSFPNLFKYNRNLKLNGEAFFEVQKGSTFTVNTALGKVQVLGTKFNVISYQDYFEVFCYEGRVRVISNNATNILTHGESIRFYDKKFENWTDGINQKPLWLTGESSFKKVPMKYVLNQFQNQYNVVVNFPKDKENIKFSGSFTHKNIETALKSICIPLNLKYVISSKKIEISE